MVEKQLNKLPINQSVAITQSINQSTKKNEINQSINQQMNIQTNDRRNAALERYFMDAT